MSIVSPSSDLRVSLVQTDLYWQSASKNHLMLSQKLEALRGQTDLIVLPEMFSSGFTMQADKASTDSQLSLEWMRQQALTLDCAVCGSLAFAVDGVTSNRMLFVTPEGDVQHYDKRHLFRMAGEHEHYTAGEQRVIVEYKGWRLLLLVCYDLRFPVFCRNQADYDAIVCVANWPAVRRQPWRVLLQARALENLSYCLGVNRVGSDDNGYEYNGDSMLVDYAGKVLVDADSGQELIATQVLQGKALGAFRDKFQAWRDADRFALLDDS